VTYTTAKLSETIRSVAQNWPTYEYVVLHVSNSWRKILTTEGKIKSPYTRQIDSTSKRSFLLTDFENKNLQMSFQT